MKATQLSIRLTALERVTLVAALEEYAYQKPDPRNTAAELKHRLITEFVRALDDSDEVAP